MSKKKIIMKDVATQTNEYVKPELTYTDKLSKKDIASYLENFEKVDDVNELKVGNNIRYFLKKGDEMNFRIGGTILNIDGLPEWIYVGAGNIKWSIQLKDAIIFKMIDVNKLRSEYEEIIRDNKMEIEKLTKYIARMKKDIKKN
uniref:Uncharacterized protein n=1 Tax=viral metagenome TaxID=1070528 RepID=A0A6C0EAF4_9ZZZZ